MALDNASTEMANAKHSSIPGKFTRSQELAGVSNFLGNLFKMTASNKVQSSKFDRQGSLEVRATSEVFLYSQVSLKSIANLGHQNKTSVKANLETLLLRFHRNFPICSLADYALFIIYHRLEGYGRETEGLVFGTGATTGATMGSRTGVVIGSGPTGGWTGAVLCEQEGCTWSFVTSGIGLHYRRSRIGVHDMHIATPTARDLERVENLERSNMICNHFEFGNRSFTWFVISCKRLCDTYSELVVPINVAHSRQDIGEKGTTAKSQLSSTALTGAELELEQNLVLSCLRAMLGQYPLRSATSDEHLGGRVLYLPTTATT
ncbi:hypothetical protein Tco_0796004 [Tanacetum coccineum]